MRGEAARLVEAGGDGQAAATLLDNALVGGDGGNALAGHDFLRLVV